MPQIQIPGYTLKRKIGQGGMAVVFQSVQDSFGRDVALKIMLPAMARVPDFAERFLREARTMASLSHPHIIVVHDVGQANGLYYYSMALHTGGDLTQRIRGGGLDPQQALLVTRQIADALAYAHDEGYVHRDIKPDNVLFREADDAAILTDFGIAKSLLNDLNQLTQAGSTLGTPKYMSPEQARGQRVDGRSDLYSLGVMLFEMLTGQPPFLAEEAVTLAIKHCQDPIPRLPSGLARLQPLIDRLLAKSPGQRPANARVLIDEIDALLGPARPAAYAARPVVDQALASAPTQIMSALEVTARGSGTVAPLAGAAPGARPAPAAPPATPAPGRTPAATPAPAAAPTQESSPAFAPPPAARTAAHAHVASSSPAATRRPAAESFYRCEESMSGGLLRRRYAVTAAFSCDDWDEFKTRYQQLQDDLAAWQQQRGRKARQLDLAIQSHPWIQGRVIEILQRASRENSPLGRLLQQAEVTVHLTAEDDTHGQLLALSGKDGKPVAAATPA